MRSHAEYKEMLSTHALNALDAEEARELEAYLETHEDLREELKEWREILSALAYAAPVLKPSDSVRERLFANIHSQKENDSAKDNPLQTTNNVVQFTPSQAERRRNIFQLITAIAACIAIIILSFLLWSSLQKNKANQAEIAKLKEQVDRERTEKSIIISPSASVKDLNGTEKAPNAKARFIFQDKTGEGVFYAENLPALPTGKAYQLWYITDPKKPVPGKTFKPEADGRVILNEHIPINGSTPLIFAVTIEDEKGATSPTGAIYLKGS